jgi:hypothetical protein
MWPLELSSINCGLKRYVPWIGGPQYLNTETGLEAILSFFMSFRNGTSSFRLRDERPGGNPIKEIKS